MRTQVEPYTIKELAPNSFVFEIPRALTPDICQDIIRRFEDNQSQHYAGRVGQLSEQAFSIKQSTDLAASAHPQWQEIDSILHRSLGLALGLLRERYPFFNGPFKDIGYNIQRTEAGQFYHWHIDGGSHDFADRQLVVIWYLNDVDGPGGETEFLYQQLKVSPRQGNMLLFPPFWTHEHRGVTLQSGVKYLATTWVVFA